MLQGLPNIGAGAAGAGSLDFLRNSQQVLFFSLCVGICSEFIIL